MKLDIASEQWTQLVGAAVMQTVTDENRDALVKEAIVHLLSPDKAYSAYGRDRSPLQKAFDDAVREHAAKHVGEILNEKLNTKVREVVEEALVKAFSEARRARLVENIADSIVKAFRIQH